MGMMKSKFVSYFARIAVETAQLSHAQRLKVGAILVKDNRILSIGYNGTPAGQDNICEYREYASTNAKFWLNPSEIELEWPYVDHETNTRYRLVTKNNVIHAEENCILKMATSTDSALGSVMFVTHQPCINCARMIYLAGVSHVYYINEYKSRSGLDFLDRVGLCYTQLEL
jgi:dCMP deaminase